MSAEFWFPRESPNTIKTQADLYIHLILVPMNIMNTVRLSDIWVQTIYFTRGIIFIIFRLWNSFQRT